MDFSRRYFRDRQLGDGIPDIGPANGTIGPDGRSNEDLIAELVTTGRFRELVREIGVRILRAYQGAGAVELGIPTLDETPLE